MLTRVWVRTDVPRLIARVIDLRGRTVGVLYDSPVRAGERALAWESGHAPLAPGVYALEVRAGDSRAVQKFVYVRTN